MCKSLIVRAETDDGHPYPECLPIEFDSASNFTPEKPTCTCWIGDPEGEGATLRQTFFIECIRPFLERVSYGNIIIEIR